MGAVASQITNLTIVYSTVYWGSDQRKYQSSTSLAFVKEFTGDRWISRTKSQERGKCCHLMTSSCGYYAWYFVKEVSLSRFILSFLRLSRPDDIYIFNYSRNIYFEQNRIFFIDIHCVHSLYGVIICIHFHKRISVIVIENATMPNMRLMLTLLKKYFDYIINEMDCFSHGGNYISSLSLYCIWYYHIWSLVAYHSKVFISWHHLRLIPGTTSWSGSIYQRLLRRMSWNINDFGNLLHPVHKLINQSTPSFNLLDSVLSPIICRKMWAFVMLFKYIFSMDTLYHYFRYYKDQR